MMDKEKLEAIKAEIERRLQYSLSLKVDSDYYNAQVIAYEEILDFVNPLLEEPKFKVGDMVVSTKNPFLTYKVLKVGLINELGKLDYEVEIFTDEKAGIKVGNTFEEHNIHLISCEKMDEWGKLIPEEPVSEELEDEYNNYIDIHDGEWTKDDYLAFARHFANWGSKHHKPIGEDFEKVVSDFLD